MAKTEKVLKDDLYASLGVSGRGGGTTPFTPGATVASTVQLRMDDGEDVTLDSNRRITLQGGTGIVTEQISPAVAEIDIDLTESLAWTGATYTWTPSADGTAVVQVQTSAGAKLLAVDTTNERVELHSDTEQLRLVYRTDDTKYASFTVGATGTVELDAISNIVLDPGGNNVVPGGAIEDDLGAYNLKWRTLYAAEMYVETLVAQDVLATIGGRILVAPTTKLTRDVASGATTIYTEHELLDLNDYIYLASAPGGVAQVEAMQITADDGVTGEGDYEYDVSRNEDGSGANDWKAGDAVANLGYAAGEGYLELTSTSTIHSHLGPTIAIYGRTATANWDDADPVVALGNLDSFLGYWTEYGLAIGNDLTYASPSTDGFQGATVDRTNGLRLWRTPIALYDGGTQTVSLAADGDCLFGSDVSAVGTTFLAISGTDQAYNAENVQAGDIVLGDHDNLNVFWDKSAGELLFRDGTDSTVKIDSSGYIRVTGDANVSDIQIGGPGIIIDGGDGDQGIVWQDGIGGDTLGYIRVDSSERMEVVVYTTDATHKNMYLRSVDSGGTRTPVTLDAENRRVGIFDSTPDQCLDVKANDSAQDALGLTIQSGQRYIVFDGRDVAGIDYCGDITDYVYGIHVTADISGTPTSLLLMCVEP